MIDLEDTAKNRHDDRTASDAPPTGEDAAAFEPCVVVAMDASTEEGCPSG